MAKHGVVRTDNMAGTDVRAQLVSVKYYASAAEGESLAIDNGCVLKLDGLVPGEREIFKGNAPAAATPLKEVVLIASPEVMYDERKRNLDEFQNEAGKACRGYHFHEDAIFAVTKEALDGEEAPEVGDLVELKAGIKMNVVKKVTGITESSTRIGTIIAIEQTGRYKYYVIHVD